MILAIVDLNPTNRVKCQNPQIFHGTRLGSTLKYLEYGILVSINIDNHSMIEMVKEIGFQ